MNSSILKNKKSLDLLTPVRRRIEQIPVENQQTARRIVSLIPADCPFERDLKLFGRTLAHIPPMCKINPLYEPLVMLRFKALCYLVDECGEDITAFS
ncbi:hypothetical protein BH23CYA1_BH23CYA1_09410 [soil metagenome]